MDRFKNYNFISTTTGQPLQWKTESTLGSGNEIYNIKNKKLYFLEIGEENENLKTLDFADKIKSRFKFILGKYYQFAIWLFSPVMPRFRLFPFQTYTNYKILQHTRGKNCVVQIGSGNDRISADILNIDIYPYPEVDMIADCAHLPFADESVDVVISNAMLEHVDSPEIFLKETFRILKKDGLIISGVPFMQGFHASPHDYWRWTNKGLDTFHSKAGFEKKELVITAGPASGFVWMFSEFIALLFSFNIGALHLFITIFMNLILMPVKLLDVFMIYFKNAHHISSFFMYIGIKKN